MIMEHTLAYTLKLCVTELKLMTRSHFIEIVMILTKYVFNVSVWLTEYSVTMESITLRFYYTSGSVCVVLEPKIDCKNRHGSYLGYSVVLHTHRAAKDFFSCIFFLLAC